MKRYCDPKDIRQHAHKPYLLGKYKFATNNHVIVFKKGSCDGPEFVGGQFCSPERVLSMIEEINALIIEQPFPIKKEELQPSSCCDICLGTGRADIKICDVCEGDGEFECIARALG